MPLDAARRLIVYYGQLIVVLSLLLSGAAFGFAYDSYANPSAERVTETVYDERVETELSHASTVTGNTTLYAPGETLEDRSVYLINVSPVLNLSVRTAATDDNVSIDQRVTLVNRAHRNDWEFWREESVLMTANETVSDGVAESEMSIDVREVRDRIDEVRNELGTLGVVQTQLVLTVSYTTDRYEGTIETAAPMQVTEEGYWIEGSVSGEQIEADTRTIRRVPPPNPTIYGSLGILGLVSLLTAIVTLVGRRRIDVEALEAEIERERFKEWISSGEFPTGQDKRFITITSLEDLVDIAIDSNKRVIHDSTYDAYAVADGDIVYYYSENRDIDSWLDV